MVFGLVIAGAATLGRKQARTARRFFGDSAAPAPKEPEGPLALPWLPQPKFRSLMDPLLSTMDAGFDPLELATKPGPFGTGQDAYYNYREDSIDEPTNELMKNEQKQKEERDRARDRDRDRGRGRGRGSGSGGGRG